MQKKIIRAFPLCVLFSFCFLIFNVTVYGDNIKIKEENGVTVVYNPKKPDPPPGVPTY